MKQPQETRSMNQQQHVIQQSSFTGSRVLMTFQVTQFGASVRFLGQQNDPGWSLFGKKSINTDKKLRFHIKQQSILSSHAHSSLTKLPFSIIQHSARLSQPKYTLLEQHKRRFSTLPQLKICHYHYSNCICSERVPTTLHYTTLFTTVPVPTKSSTTCIKPKEGSRRFCTKRVFRVSQTPALNIFKEIGNIFLGVS